jgi:CheY-like chemotaxis protein
MPGGGELSINAELLQVGVEEAKRNPDATPGLFIGLTVSDTGCGMDETTQARVFEPFFTTKETGKGTGMGLAMVYGIIKQHQGWITLDSQPGRGTTFHIYLPVAQECPREEQPPAAPPRSFVIPGGQKILVVEDEQLVADYVQTVLEGEGFQVFVAHDGVQALKFWNDRKHDIDLLLSDVVMPNGISGKDLAEKLSAEAPELKIVLTSGYSLDVLSLDTRLGATSYLLQKPYQADVLLETVRRAFEDKGSARTCVIRDRWPELALDPANNSETILTP